MPKLGKLYYMTTKSEKKLNCYSVNIPKVVVDKTNIGENQIKVYAKDNKIIIERD